MSGAADFLTKTAGPLPIGVWLLIGGGGLFVASRRGDQVTREVQQVAVPVGAMASPDGAPTVLNIVVQERPLSEREGGDAIRPTPAVPPPATTVPTPPPVGPTLTGLGSLTAAARQLLDPQYRGGFTVRPQDTRPLGLFTPAEQTKLRAGGVVGSWAGINGYALRIGSPSYLAGMFQRRINQAVVAQVGTRG